MSGMFFGNVGASADLIEVNEKHTRRVFLLSRLPALAILPALMAAMAQDPVSPKPPAKAGQTPLFRTRTDLVTIDVVVRRRNDPVAGLTPSDFRLVDRGVPQLVDEVFFAAPLELTLVIEVPADPGAVKTLTAQIQAIARALRPVDQLRVVGYGREVIDLVPPQSGTAPVVIERLPLPGGPSFLDATAAALMRPPPADRRPLVVSIANRPDASSVTNASLIPDVARRARGVLSFVLVDSIREDGRKALDAVAQLTGGRVQRRLSTIVPLVPLVTRIVDEFRQSYVLAYRPAGVPLDGWHDVEVSVPGRPDVSIRARRGYFGR